MSKLTVIREKLDKKLFNAAVLGSSSVTVSTYNEGTDGSFGGYDGGDATYDASAPYTSVPYSSVPKYFNVQSFGDYVQGDMYIVFRYNVSIKVKDKVTFLDKTYFVKEVKEIPLNDGIVAFIVQVRLKH